MTTYRLIGYWRSETDDRWPDPTDFVDSSWAGDDRELVIEHLRGGKYIRAYKGCSRCRFCGVNNGALELTDGVYLWPEGLAHYVEDHGVRLPSEFVEHVLAFDEDVEMDPSWWLEQRGPAGP